MIARERAAEPAHEERSLEPRSGAARADAVSAAHRFLHALLTHPVAMAVKRPLKNAWWRLRGRGLANPPMPGEVRSLLFVCLGNICRSPFAAARAEQLLHRAGLRSIRCASAGIQTNQANRSPREACGAAQAFGLNLETHSPTTLTRALIADHDLVVVMEAAQKELLEQRFGEFANRVLLLPLLDGAGLPGYARFNIADPFGQPLAAFESCYARIDTALQQLVRALGQSARPRESTARREAHQ